MEQLACAECGCKYGIEIHHIIPRILGGTDDQSNLEPLCSTCHKKKHLENRSELVKIGMAKRRGELSPLQNKAIKIFEYVEERLEDGMSSTDMCDLWMEAVYQVCNFPHRKVFLPYTCPRVEDEQDDA